MATNLNLIRRGAPGSGSPGLYVVQNAKKYPIDGLRQWGIFSRVNLQFIESPVYSDQIDDLLSPEEHRQLQLHLLEQPERGDIIKGAGGLRKLRWAGSGRGKRGGTRVIYYLWRGDTAFLLFAYPKNQQEDLTPAQAKLLRSLIESYTNE